MRYRRREDVVARAVAGEDLLIPIHGCTDSVYTLNPTGCRMWDLLAEARSEDELACALSEQYHISKETAGVDVRDFLAEMKRMELVTEVPHGTGSAEASNSDCRH